jgi:hypothetical protein
MGIVTTGAFNAVFVFVTAGIPTSAASEIASQRDHDPILLESTTPIS